MIRPGLGGELGSFGNFFSAPRFALRGDSTRRALPRPRSCIFVHFRASPSPPNVPPAAARGRRSESFRKYSEVALRPFPRHDLPGSCIFMHPRARPPRSHVFPRPAPWEGRPADAPAVRPTSVKLCAIVMTIAHKNLETARKCPKNASKKSAFRRDCCNSFCAFLTTNAQSCLPRPPSAATASADARWTIGDRRRDDQDPLKRREALRRVPDTTLRGAQE
jgi:hypothetical protein